MALAALLSVFMTNVEKATLLKLQSSCAAHGHGVTPGHDASALEDALRENGIALPASASHDASGDQDGHWLRFYRSADTEPLCRAVLSKHPHASRPEHIMGDVTARFHADVIARVKDLLSQHQRLAVVKAEGLSSVAQKKTIQSHYGRVFVREAWTVRRTAKPLQSCWCESHKQQCPCHPNLEAAGERQQRYVVIAGSPCIAWSSLGLQGGWLHESAIVFLCWLADTWHARPNAIIHENCPGFDHSIFEMLLGAEYEVMSCELSPSHIGLPVSRTRRYTCLVQKTLEMTLRFDINELLPIIGRRLVADGSLYFRAPGALLTAQSVKNHGTSEDESLGADLCAGFADASTNLDKTYPCRGMAFILCITCFQGDQTRMREQLAVATAKDLNFSVLNVKQSASHFAPTSLVPSLTTKSTLLVGVTLKREGRVNINREMLGYEMLGAQGYPVLLPAHHPLSRLLPKCFSFRVILEKAARTVSNTQLRSLAGNMMHMTQVAIPIFLVTCLTEIASAKQRKQVQ
eukprot:2230620-Amphidinium_carterae.6